MRIAGGLVTAAAVASLWTGTPAVAADDVVTAYNPGGMAKVMRDAGYKADLDVDDYGDPVIKTSFGAYGGTIYFYGCDETNHDRCDSVQFRAGLDRRTAMPLSLLNQVVKKYRYSAVWLDDEGDPWVNFDVFTNAGISKDVFLTALKAYTENLENVADQVFAEERGE